MENRHLLVAFVYESLRIRIERQDPTAADLAKRFEVILGSAGESCSPALPALP
jgi:hypothetical protein